jgi:hypothetical protein
MLKYIFLIIFCLFCFIQPVFAGEYTADFLRIGVGARALAMGSAFTGLANDASSAYWNPAGGPYGSAISLQFEHVPIFDGLAQYNSAHAVIGLEHNLSLTLGWIRLGVDEIPRYGELQGSRYDRLTRSEYRSTGKADGYFQDNEDALLITMAHTRYFDLVMGDEFDPKIIPFELSLGMTGKYIQQKLDDKTGTGQGIDAGALLRITSYTLIKNEPKSWIGVGAAVRDLTSSSISWNTESNHKDPMQMNIMTGVAASHYLARFKSRITLSFDKEFGQYDERHIGAEARFFHTLALRTGYYDDEMTAGAGISFKWLTLDYAFVPHELGDSHRISGSLHF